KFLESGIKVDAITIIITRITSNGVVGAGSKVDATRITL
ncbi:unnamed protein product, partial [marine sediment metagenome]